MCGICGFTGGMEGARAVVEKMCAALAHRGPDGEGVYLSEGITLGHRRLSLVDLEGGAQPMVRPHSTCALVFNGEIYNYRELRAELEEAGWQFATKSDTEVLLVGYLAWGTAVLGRLRGMFAFAIWDGAERQLFCARDPFGIKPFYYTCQQGQFVFASEIKAILEHPAYQRELNDRALEQYLCYEFNPLEETFFKGVFQLPQGHLLLVREDGSVEKQRYASHEFCAEPLLDLEAAAAKIDEAVRDSVRFHNIADVEVGCFLSSGIDSSYLAACLAEENPDVKTFTVGFGEFGYEKQERDEVSWACELARSLEVPNAHHRISEQEYWDATPLVQWHMDEPCGDPSAVALYFVNKVASNQVKAVLSGDGADELFGGYPIYQAPLETYRISWCPRPALRIVAKLLRSLGLRGANYLERAAEGVTGWYFTNANGAAFSPDERARLLRSTRASEIASSQNALGRSQLQAMTNAHLEPPQSVVVGHYERSVSWDEPARMQHVDMNCWMVGDILLKNDKMAMAHSIESRVPFLDRRVWEAARPLARSLRVTKDQTKIALRAAAERAIPRTWARKEKLGFPVPLAQWLREDERAEEVRACFTSPEAARFFDRDELMRLVDEHERGEDRSRKIWIIYAFLTWYRIYFIDRAKPPTAGSEERRSDERPIVLSASHEVAIV